MKRFKNILCYYNRKEDSNALTTAFNLAKANKAQLTVLDVEDRLSEECVIEPTSASVEKGQIKSHCKAYLEQLVEPLRRKGVVIKTQMFKGNPLQKIIQAVKKSNFDLVVTSTLGSPIRGLFWDGLALKLIRKCPVPVWIIQSSAGKTFKNILAAIDLKNDRYTNNLNKKILQMASSLAVLHQGKLTVVHGWLAKSELGLVTGHTPISQGKFQELRKEMKSAKMERLKKIVSQYKQPGLTITTKLVEKKPNLAIAETVEKSGVDLTVMGTLYRSGIVGIIMGNTAEETLPLLNSSLLAIKPDEFKSPIK